MDKWIKYFFVFCKNVKKSIQKFDLKLKKTTNNKQSHKNTILFCTINYFRIWILKERTYHNRVCNKNDLKFVFFCRYRELIKFYSQYSLGKKDISATNFHFWTNFFNSQQSLSSSLLELHLLNCWYQVLHLHFPDICSLANYMHLKMIWLYN